MAFSAVDETKMLHVPAAYGEPPKGWSWSRLDEVSEGVFDCPHSTPKLTDAGPFVVRTQDIITGVFRPDQAGRVSEETYADRVARVTPSYGDLLYSREGTYFGIAAEVPPKTRVCLGQRMVLIRADRHRLDFSFLRHWLNSPIMAAHIHGYRDGSVAERLNLPTIRALPVLIPPLAEQKAIAVVLGALDDKIELNRRMNATLEAMARALFQSWFVDFDPVRAKLDGRDPVGMDPETAALFPDSFQDSEAGHIPMGWTVRALSNHACYLSRGFGPSYLEQGGVCVVNQKCVREHRVDFSKSRRHDPVKKPINGRGLQIYDVLVNSTGTGTLGRVAQVFHLPEETIVDSHVTIIRAAADTDALFLGINLTSREVEIEELGEGSTGQTELSRARLGELKIIAPPLDLQKAFGATVTPLLMRISENECQSRLLATLRDTLMPRFLSGELNALREIK